MFAAILVGCGGGGSQAPSTSSQVVQGAPEQPPEIKRMLQGGTPRVMQGAAAAAPVVTDVVTITGYRANYTINKNQQTGVVTVTNNSTNEVQTYQNPNLIKFVDYYTTFDTNGSAGQVYRLYQAAFNRKPDPAGLGFWIYANQNGHDMLDIANGFLNSDEFKRTYGDNVVNVAYTNLLYQNVLHRTGEKAGVDWWTAALDRGTPRTNVITGFSESDENKNNVNPGLINGFDYIPFNTGHIAPKMSSYENKVTAAATVGSQVLPAEVAGGNAAAFADFFQDGTYSLVTHTLDYFVNGKIDPTRYGSIHFYKRDAAGKWVDNTAALLKDTKGCIHPRKAVVADLNNDGKPDVFFACHGVDAPPYAGEQPHVLMSQADGTYKNVTLPLTCFCHAAATIDSKSTGYADILVTDNSIQLTPFFLKNNRDGTFAIDKTRLPDFTKRAIASVELVNFGTGKYDVWFGGEDSGPNAVNVRNTMIIQNDGNDSFVNTKVTPLPASIDYGFPLDMVVNGGNMYLLRTNIEGGPANYGKNYYTTSAIQKINLNTLTSSITYTHTGTYSNGMYWVNWLIPVGSDVESFDATYNIKITNN
jgi:hypothetical protein